MRKIIKDLPSDFETISSDYPYLSSFEAGWQWLGATQTFLDSVVLSAYSVFVHIHIHACTYTQTRAVSLVDCSWQRCSCSNFSVAMPFFPFIFRSLAASVPLAIAVGTAIAKWRAISNLNDKSSCKLGSYYFYTLL